MILHRFCSAREYDSFCRGEELINTTEHGKLRGTASTSVGFCFFPEDPEDAKHWLSGIVDFDYCITVEVKDDEVNPSRGRYLSGDKTEVMYKTEYCCVTYDNVRFRLLDATTKFKSYAPSHSELKKWFPNLFV